jgi:hypothetical protein
MQTFFAIAHDLVPECWLREDGRWTHEPLEALRFGCEDAATNHIIIHRLAHGVSARVDAPIGA